MTKFYRQASLRIRVRKGDFTGYQDDPIVITGLRVQFSILKTLDWATNQAVLRVYNLSQQHRNRIKDYGDEVTLYAGYRLEDSSQVLFIGDTTVVSHAYDYPDIVTSLTCGTGEKFLNQLRVRISFSPGSEARAVLRGIAQQMGLPIIQFAPTENLIYRNGYKFQGMGKDALDIVASKLGLIAKVMDNGLYVLPQDSVIQQPDVIINANTGMIGVPQRFTWKGLNLWSPVNQPVNRAPVSPPLPFSQPVGYKVKTTLNPLILPGSPVIISSQHLDFSGRFKTLSIRHEGDTFGPQWFSDLECTELYTQGAT